MCGIIGYTGETNAKGILIKGLKQLEYRGYDSAGIAVYNSELNQIIVAKEQGRVEKLSKKVEFFNGNSGIGHTRWATHGSVNDINSHPHKFGRVTLVHNGIIENYEAIKNQLGISKKLKSETDSEIIAALIDNYYTDNHIKAIINAVNELSGTYAIAIMFDDEPDTIYAVRNVSPIICCNNNNGSYIASDIIAIGEYSEEYFILPEFSVAQITKSNINVYDFNLNKIYPVFLKHNLDIDSNSKKGYPFYMEKEITQQPDVIKQTISCRITDKKPDFSVDNIDDEFFNGVNNISIIGCGTAMHAGLIGKFIIEKTCEIPVTVDMASEYIYKEPILNSKTLVICISQSGETIDTLEALKYAKKKGAKTLSIVNVKGSAIARESENVIYTNAGTEIAVASTKAYTTQLSILYLLTAKLSLLNNKLNVEGVNKFISELLKVPQSINEVIKNKDEIHLIAKKLITAEHCFMIGRGIDYPVLLEASLKLKEISYIHSEAFASGELKHGTIALITDKTPVISLLTQENLINKQINNVKEVETRGGKVISFVKKGIKRNNINYDFELPELEDDFMPFPAVAALQYLAYYVSSDKGLDVDKPRNLAKVVTVE